MKRFIIVLSVCLVVFGIGYVSLPKGRRVPVAPVTQQTGNPPVSQTSGSLTEDPLTIVAMRGKSYPGSQLRIEQTLPPGSDFHRYIVSYSSDGLKQYGLLTVPTGTKPAGGFPVILLNHGYIPPAQYSTAESYASFVDVIAAAGYIVLKPDYRGNGSSDGIPVQPYVSPDDVTDSMNALASVKMYPDADPGKIGVFGHLMGGNISLHELVISKDIKAAELMAGVVGDETGIIAWWNQRIAAKSIAGNDLDTSYVVVQMVKDHGTPGSDPAYWNAIDPTQYISDITVPVQIQVGSRDTSVPPVFSSSLRDSLQKAGRSVDYHLYPDADHNLSPDTETALRTAVSFFDRYLK